VILPTISRLAWPAVLAWIRRKLRSVEMASASIALTIRFGMTRRPRCGERRQRPDAPSRIVSDRFRPETDIHALSATPRAGRHRAAALERQRRCADWCHAGWLWVVRSAWTARIARMIPQVQRPTARNPVQENWRVRASRLRYQRRHKAGPSRLV
jgi:hypothetical protein